MNTIGALLATSNAAATTGSDSYILWGAVLFGVALVLIVVELFVPSGGLIGVLAGTSLIGSVVAFFMYDSSWGIGSVLIYIVIVPIFIVFMFKYWMNSPVGRRLVLGGEDPTFTDPEGATDLSEQQRRERASQLDVLVGAEGVAVTALRPVGTIRIGDQRVDGMAESGVIEAGARIVVTNTYDNQIKVRALDPVDN